MTLWNFCFQSRRGKEGMHVTQCTFPGNGPVKKISCRFLVKISKFLHNYKYTGGHDHKLWRLVLWFYLWSTWYNRSFPQLYSLIGISIATEWCGSWATYFWIPTGWTYDNNDQNMNVSHACTLLRCILNRW